MSSKKKVVVKPKVERKVDSRFVTTRQAAKLCGVSIFSIQRWFDKKLFEGATLPGGRRRIYVGSLEKFMKEHNIKSVEELAQQQKDSK